MNSFDIEVKQLLVFIKEAIENQATDTMWMPDAFSPSCTVVDAIDLFIDDNYENESPL